MFLSDLARAIPGRVTLDFMALSSYGNSTRSSGQVQVLKDLGTGIEGRDVVIVEDIVDTGLTLTYLQDILRARAPRSLRTACLLSKPSRRQIDVKVDYVGFTIEDKFVVGYGLDFSEQHRNLPTSPSSTTSNPWCKSVFSKQRLGDHKPIESTTWSRRT
jgi:hypoxanthine phosphoribosyltransferase